MEQHDPTHYKMAKPEVIAVIKHFMPYGHFESHCVGSAVAYLLRAPFKGDEASDIQKALVYIRWGSEAQHPMMKDPKLVAAWAERTQGYRRDIDILQEWAELFRKNRYNQRLIVCAGQVLTRDWERAEISAAAALAELAETPDA